MWILGLAGSHNGAAALIHDGKVVVAVQAERLTRIKRDGFSLDAMSAEAGQVIQYCLDVAGISFQEIEAIAASTPWREIGPPADPLPEGPLPPFVRVPHHLAHAEYAVHYSFHEEALVLVCDGSGTHEDLRDKLDIRESEKNPVKYLEGFAKESISTYHDDGKTLSLIYRVALGDAPLSGGPRFVDSLGHLWRWASWYCHGDIHEAGKVMGLAPYGDSEVHADLATLSIDPAGKMSIGWDGLQQRFRQPNLSRRDVSGEKHYEDVAAHIQTVTNAFLLDLVLFLKQRFPADILCYSGGVALNGIANEYLIRNLNGMSVRMNGSCEDNGTAIGAALCAWHARTGKRVKEEATDYYGRTYSQKEIESLLREKRIPFKTCPEGELLEYASTALVQGKIIGWFQGRSEFGPRALGNRSILADPRKKDIKEILNRRVKGREAFRPYAPAVLEECAGDFFDLKGPSPLMLRVAGVKTDLLPGVTHVDGSARVQTVNRNQNRIFYDLIESFGKKTGIPVVLNTSFNKAGEPIVETPLDALKTFLASEMDVLVLGNAIIASLQSPPLPSIAR